MSNPGPLKPDEAKRKRFLKWLIAKSAKWELSQWEEAQGDEQPLIDAQAELAIANLGAECQVTSLTQLGAHYCILQMWEEAKKALEEAEALDRDDIWNYQHDIMLWYSRRMIAEAADAEAESQEERKEKERDCSGSSSWEEMGRQCSASVS
ncbi:hypothetical protein LEL_02127 [Akanthomyces lecanii RCEF 1005]|uniref:Tetratricopeptide-like helical n=1 Tax=Akanthomyces lecanii RCEF 1005 TaxID=1081108 RepID=A0A162KHL9_CORDF|nr:hypothetical protein LEL_02127 [Akanthomyces lecanii RCEF 1005]